MAYGYSISARVCGTIAALAAACCLPLRGAASGVGICRTTAAGVPLIVITVDLNNPNTKVTGMLTHWGSGHAERFQEMVARAHPTAAVTGTYFGVGSLVPVGDLVVNGRLVHRGGIGTGLCITDSNRCEFVHPPHRYMRMDWGDYDFVCCSGPRLVHLGNPTVCPADEGFHDHDLLGLAPRLAVGLTARNKLVFAATRDRIHLSRLARAMRRLGCIEAINLDAGSSLGMYSGGNMLIRPGRKMTNLILIYDDRSRYERFKERLLPAWASAPPRQRAVALR